MSLKDPLLSERERGPGFGVSKQQLSFLFEKENRTDDNGAVSKSREFVQQLGNANGLLRALDSRESFGIEMDRQKIEERKQFYGENTKRKFKATTLCEMICDILEDKILRILLLAAFVSLVIGVWQEGIEKGWIEGLSIYVAILIIITVTVSNNYSKEKQFRKLMEAREDKYCIVKRNGEFERISIYNLLVGDIVEIREGDSIPADLILLNAVKVTTDESNITGEPEHMTKISLEEDTEPHGESDCFLLAQSTVMSGKGLGVVCAVGVNTQQGQAESKLNIDAEQTPLQEKLEKIADLIGWVGIYAAVLTFVASVANMVIHKLLNDQSLWEFSTFSRVLDSVILSITIVVVAVPEGLPLAVTISLAYSVMKMKDDNNLVRRLDASETMGGADQICSDKTGTLTQNKMSVVDIYIEDRISKDINHCVKSTQETFFMNVGFNSTAQLLVDEKDPGKAIRQGSQTECGLLDFIKRYGQDYQKIRSEHKEVFSIPFSSKRKRMTALAKSPFSKDKYIVCVKGASEIILDMCTNFIGEKGEVKVLDEDKLKEIQEKVIFNFANQAYRTLTIAFKEIPCEEFDKVNKDDDMSDSEENLEKSLEGELTLICIVGIQDPLRDGIPEAVGRCKKSGITVRMVTGDNLDTARAIAKNAGILTERELNMKYSCMDGPTFRAEVGGLVETEGKNGQERVQNEAKFIEIIGQLRVLARSSPQDKYLLVTGLKNSGKVVAVTGDGTNDAPALKKADVGFAMGIAGTEVAKEASDIILLDDNFSTIVTAIMWGRNIYASVRKFLQFQLTVNVVAIFIAFIGGVVIGESPLTTVQLLWVNLIMDTFAALALATEPPKPELLDDKPHGRDDNIVTSVMWRNVICQSIYQVVVLCVLLFAGDTLLGVQTRNMEDRWTQENGVHFTIIFNTFVMMQVFNEINSRKIGESEFNVFDGFFNNSLFIFIEIFTIVIQIALVELGGEFTTTSHLTYNQHIICICIGAGSLIWGLFVKLIPTRLFSLTIDQKPLSKQESMKSFRSVMRKSTKALNRQATRVGSEKNLGEIGIKQMKMYKSMKTFKY